ncbi:MAG: SDR family NAD(P)-dependent oxidoreductase, partial [Bacteroidota bacterium]
AFIANVSSVFGLYAMKNQSAYCASKFAIRGFTESLRMEAVVNYPNVRIMSVHPGGIKTRIATEARRTNVVSQEEHEFETNRFSDLFINTPEYAAKKILRGIRKNKGRVVIGRDAHFLSFLQRLMPSRYISLAGKRVKKQMEKTRKEFEASRGS